MTIKAALCAVLAGCGSAELFGKYDLPESPGVAEAPYPRLADVPPAPEQGSFSAAVPDPAQGTQTQSDLAAAAVLADVRRGEVSQPVISEAERNRMLARANRPRP